MANLIKNNFNEKIAIILREQRTKQSQTGERSMFKENWMSVSKPKQADVRNPNKKII